MDSTAAHEKSNGLATYFSVLTSPVEAFLQLARTPTWGWALLVGLVLVAGSALLSMPEQIKVAHVAQAHVLSTMSSDQQVQARQSMAATEGMLPAFGVIGALVVPWFVWLISSIVFAIGAALSGAPGRFSLAWVAAVNVSIIAWAGTLVNAIILALRGPDAISSVVDASALPSLGLLVHDNVKLATFLNFYNVFYVWLYVVSIIALERTLGMKRTPAIVTVLISSVIAAGLAAAVAK